MMTTPTLQEIASQGIATDTDELVIGIAMLIDEVRKLLAKTQEVIDVTVQPPLLDQEGPALLVTVVTVVTVDEPVQGPDIRVPPGFLVAVRQRRHTGTPKGYVGGTAGAVLNTKTRTEWEDNDSFTIFLTNLDQLFFNSDSANTDFELIVEFAR